MTSWPLKWRIPAIALVLVVAAELLVGVVTLAVLDRLLLTQADHHLDQAMDQVTSRKGLILRELEGDSEGGAGQPAAASPPNDVVVAVYRASGELAQGATDRANSGASVPPIDIDLAADGHYTARDAGERWRVAVKELDSGLGTVVLMVPLRDERAATAAVRRTVIVVAALVAIAAAAAAFWATRRALAPLADAEATAAAIAAGDTTKRVTTYARGTEAGELAASLNHMLDRLEQLAANRQASEDKLRRFVADASHELRTPLAAIKGFAELSTMGADAQGLAMERIAANAQRMSSLVDDLLLLARFDEASASLSGDEEVDLAQVVREAAADLRALDPSREVRVDAPESCLVRGSSRHLRQVLANLAGNVATHTPEGSAVEFGVSSGATAGGTRVIVTVRDHGPGFGADHAAHAFERFYRSDESRARDTGGSGLGLAIVAAIVEAHGGTVGAADSDGGGAIVTVTLPTTARTQVAP